MKNKLLIILVAFILVFSSLSLAAPLDEKVINDQVRAYLKLVELRAKPEMEQIKNLYKGELSGLVANADRIVPGLKAETEQYLSLADLEQVKSPHLQGVEKSLQLAFVSLLRESLGQMEKDYKKPAQSLNSLKLVKAFYGGIENAVKRRGQYINTPNIFHDQIVYLFGYLEKEIKAGAKENITAGKKEINKIIDQVYFLSVLYELEGIAANRGKDEVLVREKQTEGKIFFRMIRNSSKDAKSGAAIAAEFTKPGQDMDLVFIKENLRLAFPEFSEEFIGKF